MATIIDVGILLRIVGAAFVAGIGLTALFSVAILGGARFADMRREGRNVPAGAYAALGGLALAVFFGSVVYGLIVAFSK